MEREAERGDVVESVLRGERFTPFTLAKKLGAKAILESASFKSGRERYSIILVREAFRVLQEKDGVFLIVDGERRPWSPRVSGGNGTGSVDPRAASTAFPGGQRPLDILDALTEIASQNAGVAPGLPVPASGIGYLGYEFARRCDRVALQENPDLLGIPEAEFIVGHIYLIFDHYADLIRVVGLNYAEHRIDLEAAVEDLNRSLSDWDFSYLALPEKATPAVVVSDDEAERVAYLEGIRFLKERIVAGDLIQAVLSRRLVLESNLNGLEGYRRLRSASPSPYLFYIDFGAYRLVGASPESLVRLRGGTATIRPIAGTRRRGADEAEDEALERELLADPKERAEHLMLVDLARNDLGRTCASGTVKTVRYMECERFSHVIHLVSEVEGRAAVGAAEVLRAAFPAGTVSGAPKLKAMELVSRVEKTRRGFYAGAVGYLDASGGLDTCIAIRCALEKGGRWYLQAGAGIVNASVAEREWEETNEKLAALRAALAGGEA